MEELEAQCDSFDGDIQKKKQARQQQKNHLQDVQDDLSGARKTHMDLINEQGQLAAEAKVRQNPFPSPRLLAHLFTHIHR